MLGFSCSTWDLYLGHVGSSSLTRDGTPTPCIGSTESYPLDQQGSCFSLYFYFSFPASTLPDHSPTLRLPTPSSLSLCLSIYGLTPFAISLLVSLCLSLSPSPCLFPSLSVTHFSLSLTALSSLSLHLCHHPPVFIFCSFPLTFPLGVSHLPKNQILLPWAWAREPLPRSFSLHPFPHLGTKGPRNGNSVPGGHKQGSPGGGTGQILGLPLQPLRLAALHLLKGDPTLWTHLPRMGPQMPGHLQGK